MRRAIKSSGLISATEFMILDSLISYADAKSCKCYPGINRLVEQAQKSIRTVERALRSMEIKGVIKCAPQFRKDGTQTTNLYTVNLDKGFWGKLADLENCKKNERTPIPADSVQGLRNNLNDNSDTIFDSDNKSREDTCQSPEKPETAHHEPKKHGFSKGNHIFSPCKKNFEEVTLSHSKLCKATQSHSEKAAKKVKAAEIISMDEIRARYRYNDLVEAHKTMTDDIIDPLFNKIYYALNEKRETITVKKGVVMPTKAIAARINRLTQENLETIIKRVAEGFNEIKNLGAYLLNCLINFVDNTGLNIRREVNRDMLNGAAMPGAEEETADKELITVGDVLPDGRIKLNITRLGSDRSEASAAPLEEVPGAEEPISETLCMTQEEAVDRLLSSPGKTDYEALMRIKDPSRFAALPAAYTA